MAIAERIYSALQQGFGVDEIEDVLGNPGVVVRIKNAFDSGFKPYEVDQLLSTLTDKENINYRETASTAPMENQLYQQTYRPEPPKQEPIISANAVGNVVRNLPFAPLLPNSFIKDASQSIANFTNQSNANVEAIKQGLFPRDAQGNIIGRTAQEASDMPEQFDENLNVALQKTLNETVKPVVYPLAMVGVPGAGAIAAPLFLTDVTRTLREKTQEAIGQGYSNNITDMAMIPFGKTDNALAQGVIGTVAEFTPFYNMGKEIAQDPATWVEKAKSQPASTMYDIGMNALMVYLIGKGLVTKAPKTMEEAKQIIEAEKSNWTAADQALADALGNKKHMLNPDLPEMRQTLAEVLMKIAEQKWDKAEITKPQLETRTVLGELTPRIPNPTQEAVLNALKKKPYEALFDRADAGKVDIVTRQLRELDPYQQWWYENAEGIPERRVQPKPEIADFIEYRDIIQQETGANPNAMLAGLQQLKNQQIAEMVKTLQNDIKKNGGVENVREFSPTGEKVKGYRVSYNPQWYRDYFAEHKKPPTKADMLRIAENALENGIDLAFEQLPPSAKYNAIKKTIESVKESKQYSEVIDTKSQGNPVDAANLMIRYYETPGELYGGLAGFEKIAKRLGLKGAVVPAEKGSVRAGVYLASDVNKSIFQRGREAFESAYTAGIDALDPINVATKGAEKLVGKLAAEENPYILARNANSGATARAEMLVSGKADSIPTLRKFYNLPHEATMQGVVDALPKGKVTDAIKAEGFNSWQDALAGYVTAKRQLELQKLNPEYVGSMEPAQAAKYVAQHSSTLGKAADLFTKFNDNVLQIAVDGGLVSKEVAAVLRDKYKNYASMARDFSDVSAMDGFFGTNKGYVNVAGVLKNLKEGSERAVVNPLETAIKNAYVVLARVERNKVAQSIADLADAMEGIPGAIAKRVDTPANPTKSTFSVMRNGERQYYQTTPELYRALTSMDAETAGMLAKVLAYPAGWLRAGATLDPGFFAKNVTRDAFTAALYSKAGFIPGVDTLRGIASLIGKPQLVNEFKASGAPMSVITAMDRNSLAKAIQHLDGKSLWTNYNPVELLRTVTGFFENATRIREYEMVRNKGGSILDAATAAKDVTLDFSRKGGRMVEPNMIVSFLNAGLQGTDRFIRAMKDNPLQTTTRGVMAITIPSVALWMANHDDVRYQELPSYQRDLFWVIPTGPKLTREKFNALLASGKSKAQIMDEAGTLIRIPKPFEPGIVFGSLPERLLDYAYTKDPSGMSKWAKTALQQLAPNIVPTAVAPIIEGVTNYSFFTGRDIVPQSKEKLPAKMQYQPYNTELSKKLGSMLDTSLIPGGVSPAKIDNAIAGVLGGLGKTTIDAVELAAGLRNGRPDKLLTEQPIIRSFFITPLKGAESVQDFYAQYKRQSELYEEFKTTKVKPADFNPALYNRLNETNKEIQALNKAAKAIEASKMSDDAKRKQMDAINIGVLSRARQALKK